MAEPMTITIDPQRQQQIERYCALSGVNKDKAMEELWNLWEKIIAGRIEIFTIPCNLCGDNPTFRQMLKM